MCTIILFKPGPHDLFSCRRVTSSGHLFEQGIRCASFFICAPVKLPSSSDDSPASTGAENQLAVGSALLRYIAQNVVNGICRFRADAFSVMQYRVDKFAASKYSGVR